MYLPYLFGLFLVPFSYADTINIVEPALNQVFTQANFNVEYNINRNDMFFISNTTTELLDTDGNSLVSFFKDTSDLTNVRIEMRTFVQPGSVKDFVLRVTGYARHELTNETQFSTKEVSVPIKLDLSGQYSSMEPQLSKPKNEIPEDTIAQHSYNTASFESSANNSHHLNLYSTLLVLLVVAFV